MEELARRPSFHAQLIHTGQHWSQGMSGDFFRDLGIREPDINLGVSGGTHAQQTAEIMKRIEPVLEARRPDALIVVGDVNSTMAAALVAAKLQIPVAHVEAGLRSFDRSMPEEINRIVTDAVSDYLFTTEPGATRNLLAEGHRRDHVFFVGNVMIDTLLRFRLKSANSEIGTALGVNAGQYAVATLHRPSNVDQPDILDGLISMLECLSETIPVVFPVHPRTRERLRRKEPASKTLILTEPMGYIDFLWLLSNAKLVLTDSGGIQEETTILGVQCLTLRENTERPITIEQGTNRLVGKDPAKILPAALEALSAQPAPRQAPALWDGGASKRIFDILDGSIGGQP